MEPSLSDSYKTHISDAIQTIIDTYPTYQAFLYALKDLPGNHGITDVHIAQESISNITDHTSSVLNLSVIVEAETGIDLSDARSRVTEALEGYAAENTHRVAYEFRTFEDYHSSDGERRGALTSMREISQYDMPTKTSADTESVSTSAMNEVDEGTDESYDEAFAETKEPNRDLQYLLAGD